MSSLFAPGNFAGHAWLVGMAVDSHNAIKQTLYSYMEQARVKGSTFRSRELSQPWHDVTEGLLT
jgi:hypothetical protein